MKCEQCVGVGTLRVIMWNRSQTDPRKIYDKIRPCPWCGGKGQIDAEETED